MNRCCYRIIVTEWLVFPSSICRVECLICGMSRFSPKLHLLNIPFFFHFHPESNWIKIYYMIELLLATQCAKLWEIITTHNFWRKMSPKTKSHTNTYFHDKISEIFVHHSWDVKVDVDTHSYYQKTTTKLIKFKNRTFKIT